MKKIIIQIPCYNEEETLGTTLKSLPRSLPGIDRVEWLIINDGSTDKTIEVAKSNGVDHVISFNNNQGLAKAFMAGVQACISLGADIIVNTDADNQYCADDIPKLIDPILLGKAEIVIGERPINKLEHFSLFKKSLQKIGSWVIRIVSDTNIPDAPSGFRALSRDAAMQLNIFNGYTYTLEMIVQAGQKGVTITSVPINVNEELRPSRLVKSIRSYIWQSVFTILRIFMTYNPLRFFVILGTIPLTLGFILSTRWIWLFFIDGTRTHVPSLILAAILIIIGFQLWMFGLVADLMAVNRRLLEDIQLKVRRSDVEYQKDMEL